MAQGHRGCGQRTSPCETGTAVIRAIFCSTHAKEPEGSSDPDMYDPVLQGIGQKEAQNRRRVSKRKKTERRVLRRDTKLLGVKTRQKLGPRFWKTLKGKRSPGAHVLLGFWVLPCS